MRATNSVRFLTLASILAFLPFSATRAEDTKGKWQFGFGLSYFATKDYIRSNADLAISSGIVDETGLPSVGSVDERPDQNILNQPSIQDDFKLDLSASYGITRWLALEAAVGYMKAPVGNIEFYYDDKKLDLGSAAGNKPTDPTTYLCGPGVDDACYGFTAPQLTEDKINTFLPVGTLTEIPVHLSGLVRFRPESPFDPYIGLGAGYVQTSLQMGDEFNRKRAELASRTILTGCEGDFTTGTCDPTKIPGLIPKTQGPYFNIPLTATVKNAFEWHAVGGVDYYVNERFSVYVDARYSWNTGAVQIYTDGQPQVRLAADDQGRLLLTNKGKVVDQGFHGTVTPDGYTTTDDKTAYYLWEDTGFHGIGNDGNPINCVYSVNGNPVQCAGDGLFESEDKNFNGTLDAEYKDPRTGEIIPNEDDGKIWVLPPGSRNPAERIDNLTFDCPQCVGNGPRNTRPDPSGSGPALQIPDSEDRNFNQTLDRFLVLGVDICSTPQGAGNPLCKEVQPASSAHYIWPEGCPQNPPGAGSRTPEGCPPPAKTDFSTTQVDSTADVYLIQGGRIHLGGFSLGVGLKFTF